MECTFCGLVHSGSHPFNCIPLVLLVFYSISYFLLVIQVPLVPLVLMVTLAIAPLFLMVPLVLHESRYVWFYPLVLMVPKVSWLPWEPNEPDEL